MNKTQDASVSGTLETESRGGGFLRNFATNYAPSPKDAFVPPEIIKAEKLRGGEYIEGWARPDPRRQGGLRVAKVERVCGVPAADFARHVEFGELTVIDPREAIRLSTVGGPGTTRVIDLMTPIGKGQRGIIVAPPRTGKTILLQQMAKAVIANHPDMLLMMLLVDERPEEVTEMRRSVAAEKSGWHETKPEVVWSTNDKDANSHTRIAKLMIEKAKRYVEAGRDVLILMDSLTRLSRAFNTSIGSSGRTMTGGLDIRALIEPKSMFGAARKIENGGSLTIIASVLIETGSRQDDSIFQEFKGTGNMELVLTRELSNLRLFPAVDIPQSGTRKEELLLGPDAINKIARLRRRLLTMPLPAQIETLLKELERHKTNADFLASMAN